MRIKLISVLIVLLLISGCAAMPTMLEKEQATVDISDYGPCPTISEQAIADYGQYPSDYEEIVHDWINRIFFDPQSVYDLTISKPVKAWIQEPAPIEFYIQNPSHLDFGKTYYSYRVSVTCNAKNRMGGYVGRKTFKLHIRNGIIIKSD